MSTEPNAPANPELAAFEREAQSIAGELLDDLNPPDPNAPAPIAIDPTQDARDLIDFAHASLTPLWPSLAKVYPEDVRQRIAVAGGRVLQKYGVTMADLFAAWAPEISLALVVVPLIYPTVLAIRHDREAAAQPKAPPAPVTTADGNAAFEEPAAGANPLERFGQ